MKRERERERERESLRAIDGKLQEYYLTIVFSTTVFRPTNNSFSSLRKIFFRHVRETFFPNSAVKRKRNSSHERETRLANYALPNRMSSGMINRTRAPHRREQLLSEYEMMYEMISPDVKNSGKLRMSFLRCIGQRFARYSPRQFR